jgi:hypothetical protein
MTSALSEPAQLTTPIESRSAPAPVAAAAASRAAVLLALVVVTAGVVGIRDALVDLGWIGGTQWLRPTLDVLDGLTPSPWMVAVGVILGVLGIALMVVALAPRRKTAVAVADSAAVYLHRADVSKLVSAAAQEVPGVLDARASVSRRMVVVRCRVTGHPRELRPMVADTVAKQLEVLRTPQRVIVRLRTETNS